MTPFATGLTVLLAGCSGSTDPEAGLVVRFRLDQTGVATARVAAAVAASIEVSGSNGTLILDEVWLIVDEFKLEVDGSECDEEAAVHCEKFEAAPAFVSVPLDGELSGTVVNAAVPAGTYTSLKFETKAPGSGAALLAEIRAQIPEWPEGASALVVGTFTPEGGDPVPFRVFFDAEVKVELAFEEPLVIREGEGETVSVFVDPALWFAQPGGTVLDLSQLDFATTGELFKLEANFIDGFTKIEVE
jgi:hypothetical protein